MWVFTFMKNLISLSEIIGKTGNWQVLEELDKVRVNGRLIRKVRCKCVCGKIKEVLFTHLRFGKSTSCGCIVLHTKTHGLTKHKLYGVWSSMKQRCYDKNKPRYKDWGGRGIIVSEKWRNDFMEFYNWCIENGYEKGLQIDRINNDGNYGPENCRFVTAKVNSQNRRKRNGSKS